MTENRSDRLDRLALEVGKAFERLGARELPAMTPELSDRLDKRLRQGLDAEEEVSRRCEKN